MAWLGRCPPACRRRGRRHCAGPLALALRHDRVLRITRGDPAGLEDPEPGQRRRREQRDAARGRTGPAAPGQGHPGKSASGLVDAISAALKTKLDAWVSAGKLSSTREASILAAATPKIEKLVNLTWTQHTWSHGYQPEHH